MESTSTEMIGFHCPRWKEFPEIDLYMDQVVSILEKHLSIFTEYKGEKIITSTMINNYVKQKVVTPPLKKRYNREHLAYFFFVCIMKRILSISEICDLIACLTSNYSIEQSYDLFCDEIEVALKAVFSAKDITSNQQTNTAQELILLESAALAFANKMYFQVGIKNLTATFSSCNEKKR